MKKLLIIALLAGGLFACGEVNDNLSTDDIPAAVLSTFNAAYPNATEVEWEMEDGAYEVEFEVNGEEMEIYYDASGTVLEMED